MKVLEINSKDLEHNINKVKARAKDKKIIAVVKGNGYGLGLEEFATFLINHEINYLAVSSVEEAIELADKQLDATVLCLEATSIKEEIENLLDKNVVITIGNRKSAKILNELAKAKKVKAHVHLKIDTGFSRYGFLYNEKEEILKTIKECTSILIDGVYSHFSFAYSKSEEYTRLQYERFLEVKKFLEENKVKIPMYHICNSAAFLKYDDMFLDAVRIGSAFIGGTFLPNNIGLRKIGKLKSNIVEIKEVKKGTFVGYSNSVKVKKDTSLAIVPVGYSDGFHVGVKNNTFKFIDKVRLLKKSLESFFKDERICVLIKEKNIV